MQELARRLVGQGLVTVAACTAAVTAFGQDTPQPGYQIATLPNPAGSVFAFQATLANEDVVVWDGAEVRRHAEDGALLQTLATLDPPVYASFLRVDPTETFAVFGESTVGDLFRVDLLGGSAPVLVANLHFNFDAVFEDDDHLIVSAATGGFSAGNELLRVNVHTGETTPLAHLEGPSGPLALDAFGGLFYATQDDAFPPPPGATDVLYFPPGVLDGLEVADESDALLFGGGFDGGASLAYDDELHALYLAESNVAPGQSRVWRVNGGAASSSAVVVAAPAVWIFGLELATSSNPALFQPFQPASGGRLRYSADDFAGFAARVEVRPRRPELTLFGPGLSGAGPFDLRVDAGPPGGFAIVAYAPNAAVLARELALAVIPDAPLFLGLDPAALYLVPTPLALDALGAGTLHAANPGGLEGLLSIQALALDAALFPRGTSPTAAL